MSTAVSVANRIGHVVVTDETITAHLVDGRVISVPLAWVLGLVRMFFAGQYRQASANTSAPTFMVFEAILFAAALVMTFKAFSRD